MSFTAKAQDQATLVGSVTDASGAAIPGAKVTVTRPDVSFTRDLVTNSAGEYTAARIPIGDYVITAEATGFQKLVRSGITLQVGQTLRVDLQMTVGQVNQEVTVRGSAVKVETENATVSDVVSGGQI
ncbi:MAG: TonB-dependent receptor, partial [Acidobacteria bacterium]